MRIAVCDDERELCRALAEKVRQCVPEAEVCVYLSGEELLCADILPDILLLDIRMQGRSGMETAAELRKKSKDLILIFVTAMEEYVFAAFDVGAFHYLVKPFTDEKLAGVLEKAVAQYRERKKHMPGQEEPCILVKAGGTRTKILLRNIVYAEVFNRKVRIHTVDGSVEYYGKLSKLEDEAGESFFRTHRAYLVHLKYVEKYTVDTVYLEGVQVLMAKEKYAAFVKAYMRYVRRGEGAGF